jgi:hypothetical protein
MSNTPKIVWADPTKVGARRTDDHEAFVEALKSRPGQWAIHPRSATQSPVQSASLAISIRHARVKAYRPAGAFEAAIRRVDDEHTNVYARYVGTPDD